MFDFFHRTFRQNDVTKVADTAMVTSSSTETSSFDNSVSADDHSTVNQDTFNGNDAFPANEDAILLTCCAMQSLRQSIAFEKAKLMRNVEVNSDKIVLDEGIDRLHALQRQYFALEKKIEYGSQHGDQVCSCHRENDEPCIDKSVAASISTSPSNCSCFKNKCICTINVNIMYFSATGSGEYAICLPRFVVCGSGSSGMHYEYEIAINLATDKWTIMRRYSRFREMHLTMKRRYGDAVRKIHSYFYTKIIIFIYITILGCPNPISPSTILFCPNRNSCRSSTLPPRNLPASFACGVLKNTGLPIV